MIIYKCDICDRMTTDDILPSDWSVLQVQGPQGMENMKVRHVCNNHTVETLLRAARTT
jgi:hypothetical protein